MNDSIFPTFEQAATLHWLMETNYDLVSTTPWHSFTIFFTVHVLLNLFQ